MHCPSVGRRRGACACKGHKAREEQPGWQRPALTSAGCRSVMQVRASRVHERWSTAPLLPSLSPRSARGGNNSVMHRGCANVRRFRSAGINRETLIPKWKGTLPRGFVDIRIYDGVGADERFTATIVAPFAME